MKQEYPTQDQGKDGLYSLAEKRTLTLSVWADTLTPLSVELQLSPQS
jgi:hypothetical protein